MNIRLQGTNLDLTDELRAVVDDKLSDCYRAFGDMNLEPVEIAIELERTTRRHPRERKTQQRFRAEANVSVPGRMIRAEASAPDLHQAIVKMKTVLSREIRDWRSRLIDDQRKGARRFKEALAEETPKEQTPEK